MNFGEILVLIFAVVVVVLIVMLFVALYAHLNLSYNSKASLKLPLVDKYLEISDAGKPSLINRPGTLFEFIKTGGSTDLVDGEAGKFNLYIPSSKLYMNVVAGSNTVSFDDTASSAYFLQTPDMKDGSSTNRVKTNTFYAISPVDGSYAGMALMLKNNVFSFTSDSANSDYYTWSLVGF